MALLISDVGPTPNSFVGATPQRSGSGRILCLALAADGQRMYAGSYAGVWRSDDGGRSFTQMSRPQPGSFEANVPGALQAPHIFDIAVSPADPEIVLAAAVRSQFIGAPNGIWRSTDGGQSWTLVQPAFRVGQIVFAPDDPSLVIAPIGDQFLFTSIAISHDAGRNWSVRSLNPAWHVAIGPLEGSGVRRVYAAGNNVIWYSINGGSTWRLDSGANVVVTSRAATSAFIVATSGDPNAAIPAFAGRTGDVSAAGPQALAIEPGNPFRVYLAAQGGTFGLSYFARDKNNNPIPDGTQANVSPIRLAGEGSLWTADFSGFETNGAAQWESVPGPPLYSGATTPSGLVFVQCRPTSSGYMIFFADQSSVYMAVGRPLNSIQWHRLDGWDASADWRADHAHPHEHVLVHPDPHALVVSADFDVTLKPVVDVPSPYNQNSELDEYVGGTIWMANDGGVVWSADGGVSWNASAGLPTLDPVNVAGLSGHGGAPALYIGTGDNDSFFTTDGGVNWRNAGFGLGDADAWFADIARADWVMQFAPQSRGGPGVVVVRGGPYPDAGNSGNWRRVPPPANSTFSSGFVLRGYAPLVRTLATEAAPSDGDVVVIGTRSDGARVVFRTQAISGITNAAQWEDLAHAQQEGPPLPVPAPGMVVGIVQASGGHLNPAIFVSDTVSLWSLDRGLQTWRLLVPGGPPGRSANTASRFWVDPFNPLLIYLLDFDRFRVSLDGGASWLFDADLTRAMSGDGKLDLRQQLGALPGVVRDILFVRTERFARFAFGSAGVLYTVDGVVWQKLLNAIALGGCPESGFFDGITDPLDRTLYVELEGRSILRISGVPAPPVLSPPDFSLMDLAAILAEA
jgi:hypothetical protein